MAEIGGGGDDRPRLEFRDELELAMDVIGTDGKNGQAVILKTIELDAPAAQHRDAIAQKDAVAPLEPGPAIEIGTDREGAPALGIGYGVELDPLPAGTAGIEHEIGLRALG